MGGFSSQVQSPQASQPSSGGGKFGNQIAEMAQEVSNKPSAQQEVGNFGFEGNNFQQSISHVIPQGGGDGLGGTGLSRNMPQPMGKGGYTNSATSGQPRMGMQNQYSNTVGQWDNSQIQPLQPKRGGKGKGG
jgi:hypothetical protein